MTEEELKQLEEFAQLYLTLGELELLMERPEGSFTDALESQNEIGRAIMRGRLITKAKLRQKTRELAIGGSSPALDQMKAFEAQMEVREA